MVVFIQRAPNRGFKAQKCQAIFVLTFSISTADPAQPFDFLISGELLRQPLEKFLLAHNVSTVRFTAVF